MYQKYCQLEIDGRWIGLEKTDLITEYFCTPVDASIIGWSREQFEQFIVSEDNANRPEQQKVLDAIRTSLK